MEQWFGKGCESQICKWENENENIDPNYRDYAPVLVFCKNQHNPEDTEGNCTPTLCPICKEHHTGKGMSEEQYYLTQLAQECQELAMAANKATMFGLHSSSPFKDVTNAQEVKIEFNDIMAVFELLDPYIDSTDLIDDDLVAKKVTKVRYWMQTAKKNGRVQ